METGTLECRKCGIYQEASSFYSRRGKPNTTWCKTCYREWHRSRYTPKNEADDSPRDCAVCGEPYRPGQRMPSIYCSRACKDKAKGARLAKERLESKPTDRECLHCGAILPQSVRVDAIFCSQKCNEGAHALQRKLRARTGQDNKPGYLRAAICKRDRWTCGICEKPVNPRLQHPHPMTASLDHIIPVCQGGLSEPANLRLVHLVCNLRRRHLGGGEQLALI